jgi:hypothetical protein
MGLFRNSPAYNVSAQDNKIGNVEKTKYFVDLYLHGQLILSAGRWIEYFHIHYVII